MYRHPSCYTPLCHIYRVFVGFYWLLFLKALYWMMCSLIFISLDISFSSLENPFESQHLHYPRSIWRLYSITKRPDWSQGMKYYNMGAHERGYSDTRHCQICSSNTRHWRQKMLDTQYLPLWNYPDTRQPTSKIHKKFQSPLVIRMKFRLLSWCEIDCAI